MEVENLQININDLKIGDVIISQRDQDKIIGKIQEIIV